MYPLFLSLFVNWCVKPFTMYAIALLFLVGFFRGFIGADATDLVKIPFGLDLAVGAQHGAGTVVLADGMKMLQVPLWRSYFAGCIVQHTHPDFFCWTLSAILCAILRRPFRVGRPGNSGDGTMENRWLSVDEIAAYLGVKRDTI